MSTLRKALLISRNSLICTSQKTQNNKWWLLKIMCKMIRSMKRKNSLTLTIKDLIQQYILTSIIKNTSIYQREIKEKNLRILIKIRITIARGLWVVQRYNWLKADKKRCLASLIIINWIIQRTCNEERTCMVIY